MTPERYREVGQIFRAAAEIPPDRRAAFLDAACGEDQALRQEVESLFVHDAQGEDWIDGRALDVAAQALASKPSESWVGRRVHHYQVLSLLARGGMGEVYKARDTRLNRNVAIKIVHERFGLRFEREARAISSLNHPHVCTLYDVGPNYLVMELVEGETLAARLEKRKLPLELVLRYGAEIADALAAAHAKGIIHRDLKPGNVMITKSGVKVLDFGLARAPEDETLTSSLAPMGTPAYMAPEQREGKKCDARTDIYALGLLLHEAVTGKRLVAGQPANLADVPEKTAHVIARCLEQDPEERWQSAIDLKRELAWAASMGRPPSAPGSARMRWTAAMSAVFLIVLAGAWWIGRRATPAPFENPLAGAQFTRFTDFPGDETGA